MIVNGIFYVLKNDCVWRDVPADLPPWVTVYYYYAKWSADGTRERVSGCLSIAARERAKKGPAHRHHSRQPKRKKYSH